MKNVMRLLGLICLSVGFRAYSVEGPMVVKNSSNYPVIVVNRSKYSVYSSPTNGTAIPNLKSSVGFKLDQLPVNYAVQGGPSSTSSWSKAWITLPKLKGNEISVTYTLYNSHIHKATRVKLAPKKYGIRELSTHYNWDD